MFQDLIFNWKILIFEWASKIFSHLESVSAKVLITLIVPNTDPSLLYIKGSHSINE